MKSIIRTNADDSLEMKLADLYAHIREGKNCPEFYRKANLLMKEEKDEYLILEALGKGHSGFVFLAYHQRKLTALKMSNIKKEDETIFSTVKKAIVN